MAYYCFFVFSTWLDSPESELIHRYGDRWITPFCCWEMICGLQLIRSCSIFEVWRSYGAQWKAPNVNFTMINSLVGSDVDVKCCGTLLAWLSFSRYFWSPRAISLGVRLILIVNVNANINSNKDSGSNKQRKDRSFATSNKADYLKWQCKSKTDRDSN